MPAAASPTSACRTIGAPTSRSIRGRNNFDDAALRVLSRPERRPRGVQGRPDDLRVENSSAFLGHRLRRAGAREGADHQARDPDRGRQRDAGLRVQYPPGQVRRIRRVRQALGYAFDFEWTNKNLFYGQYTRTDSYFSNSELAAHGLPGPDELALLEPFRDRLPQEVFDQEYQAAGDRRLRQQPRQSPRGRGTARRRPATRSAAASSSIPRPASRWRSRSCSIRAACSSASSGRSRKASSGWA